MLRLCRYVLAAVFPCLLASCSGTMRMGNLNPLQKIPGMEGETYYTRANMCYDKNRTIRSANVRDGKFLPAGTKTTIGKAGWWRIPFRTDGGTTYKLKHSIFRSTISASDLFSRYFAKDNPRSGTGPFGTFNEEEKRNIANGTVALGMSKDAVLMAYGWPPSHMTASPDTNEWHYLVGPAGERSTLVFEDGYLAETRGANAVKKVQVYVVSDPPGTAVHVDGAFSGIAPCIVAFTVKPENLSESRTIRVQPSDAGRPSLGLLCDIEEDTKSGDDNITVREIVPTSPAAAMGLRAGDRITIINGARVRTARACAAAMKAIGFGQSFALTVMRADAPVNLKGTAYAQPKDDLKPREKQLRMVELLQMDRKILRFDLKPETAKATSPPAAETAVRKAVPTGKADALGFVIAAGSYALTAAAPLAGAKSVTVRGADGTEHAAVVIMTDRINDWCLLKIPTLHARPLPLAPAASLAKGSRVYCIAGSKKGEAPAAGTVAAEHGLNRDPRHMQTTVAAGKLLPGAPLVDEKGRWMGLLSRRLNDIIRRAVVGLPAGTESFALKSTVIRSRLGSSAEGLELKARNVPGTLSGAGNAVITVHVER